MILKKVLNFFKNLDLLGLRYVIQVKNPGVWWPKSHYTNLYGTTSELINELKSTEISFLPKIIMVPKRNFNTR